MVEERVWVRGNEDSEEIYFGGWRIVVRGGCYRAFYSFELYFCCNQIDLVETQYVETDVAKDKALEWAAEYLEEQARVFRRLVGV